MGNNSTMQRIKLPGWIVIAIVIAGVAGAVVYHVNIRRIEQRSSILSSSDVTLGNLSSYDSRIGTAPDKTYSLTIDNGKITSRPASIVVSKGQNVSIALYTTGRYEYRLQLSGYDVITETNSTAPGGFNFIADKAGTFPFYMLSEQINGQATQTVTKTTLGTVTIK